MTDAEPLSAYMERVWVARYPEDKSMKAVAVHGAADLERRVLTMTQAAEHLTPLREERDRLREDLNLYKMMHGSRLRHEDRAKDEGGLAGPMLLAEHWRERALTAEAALAEREAA